MVLVTAADDRYAMHLAVMLYSGIVHLTGDATIFVLDGGIRKSNWRRLEDIVESASRTDVKLVRLQPAADRLTGVQPKGHVSQAAFLRLLMADMLPNAVHKVVYLDADMVIERDLRDLWTVSLAGHCIGAVQDFSIPLIGDGITHPEVVGVDPSAPYFNSGVLLIDLQQWREEDIGHKALWYTREVEERKLSDQEALNIVLCNNWQSLHRRWNVPPHMLNLAYWSYLKRRGEAERREASVPVPPAIIHFVGQRKPWRYGIRVAWEDRYFYYLHHSGWFKHRIAYRTWQLGRYLAHKRQKAQERYRAVDQRLRPLIEYAGR